MNLEDLRLDCAIKQKKGITFCCTAPLMPIAFFLSQK